MLYRITRKLLPPGMQFNSVVFFAFDLRHVTAAMLPSSSTFSYQRVASSRNPIVTLLTDAFPANQFRLRLLQGGQQLYVVTAHDQLAAYAWVTTSESDISEIHFSFTVASGGCYIYDCFVMPDFRGQGLYKALLRRILSDYAQMPCHDGHYETASIAAEIGNTASIRGITSTGFREIARATYVSIGRHARLFGPGDLSENLRFSDLSTPGKRPCDNRRDAQ